VIPAGFSRDELVQCAEREVRQREKNYPRLVELGRLTRSKAEAEIATMKAIVTTLRQLPAVPPPQGEMFDAKRAAGNDR
jgi:hypothetical protein